MTMDLTLDPPRQAAPIDAVTNQGASSLVATSQVAARTLKKFVRSPALLIAGTAQGAALPADLPLRLRRRGGPHREPELRRLPGARLRRHRGALPGHERRQWRRRRQEGGLFDRLRSLPIRLLSIVTGRVSADTALVAWGVVVMTVVGFAVGFRISGPDGRRAGGPRADHPLRLRLRLDVHRHGPHGGQPAGGAGALVPGLPAELRLVGLRAGVDHAGLDAGLRQQPAHDADGQHGALAHRGPAAQELLGHSVSYYLVPSLLWTAGLVVVFAIAVGSSRR